MLTSMLSLARSLDRPLGMAMPAAREIEVGIELAPGVRPPRLVTLMIRPPPTLRISGMDARIRRTAPQTLSSKSSSQSSSLTSSNPLAMDVPALLTRISTRPYRSTAVLTTRAAVALSVTSAERGSTSPSVAVRISFAAASRTSCRRATIITFAPSPAMRWAAAFPIPSLPPVTMATLPSNPISMARLLCVPSPNDANSSGGKLCLRASGIIA